MDIQVFDSLVGHYVSQKHSRIAQLIADYDENLKLVWIPPSERIGETHPFAILYKNQMVRKLREDEVDERLVAWLWSNDQERNSPLVQVRKMDEAQEALKLLENLEEQDVATTILKSPLHTFKHNGKVYK